MENIKKLGDFKSLRKIYDLCFKIQNEEKATVFINIIGHTEHLQIDLHEGRWSINSEPINYKLRLFNDSNYSDEKEYKNEVEILYKQLMKFYINALNIHEIEERFKQEREANDFEIYKILKEKFESKPY